MTWQHGPAVELDPLPAHHAAGRLLPRPGLLAGSRHATAAARGVALLPGNSFYFLVWCLCDVGERIERCCLITSAAELAKLFSGAGPGVGRPSCSRQLV